MSGYLLQNYCPEEGERHSKMMWLIIGLTTAVSPVLLTVFWKYVSSKDEDSKYTELRDIRSSQITEEDLEMDVGQWSNAVSSLDMMFKELRQFLSSNRILGVNLC